MSISIWKDGEPLTIGKLVLHNSYYLIVIETNEASSSLQSPLNGEVILAMNNSISPPHIEPWAERILKFSEGRISLPEEVIIPAITEVKNKEERVEEKANHKPVNKKTLSRKKISKRKKNKRYK